MRAVFGRYLPLIGAVCGILSPCALGSELLVPSQYATIQAGIDAAVAGDTVLVADGTYTGVGNKDLDFHGKGITVRSASGDPTTCIIDCEGSGRGFYFHSGETAATVVRGFTIRNGSLTSNSTGWGCGGAVYCYSSSPTLTNCTITGDTACNYGGGVYCGSSSDPTLTNCTITGNGASYGAGVYCEFSSNPTLTNCAINGNTASVYGGAVSCHYASSPTLTKCLISGNMASYGGAVYCTSASSLALGNCTISGNTASTSGGAVYCCSSSSPTLTNCTISGNSATYDGSAVCCHSSSSPTLTNCTISGNSATYDGGAVCCYSSSPTLTNCILWADTPQEICVESGTPAVTHCDVQGGYTGTGNLNVDPEFAFGADFHLVADSPCIDGGTNTPGSGLPASDADGNARPLDGDGDGEALADIGGYEFNPSAPAIAVSPARIEFYVPGGQGAAQPQTLSLRNAGAGTLHWRLSWDGGWLVGDALEGESTGAVDTVTLTTDAGALLHGAYGTALLVSDVQASNKERMVEVVLYVNTTLHVPSEYATIQAAIDATVPGDEVIVADGAYTGTGNKDLDFGGKDITLRSASGDPAVCIIDCEQSGRGFYFHTSETAAAVVSGFTIRNAKGTSSSPGSYFGGAICCKSSSPTLTNCTISGNSASTAGGALYCWHYSSPTLTNCTISANTASFGGGVYCGYSSSPTLTNCTISANTASYGGGVYCESSSNPTLTNCTMSGNWASTDGGAVYCYHYCIPRLTNCTISANTASCGAGAGFLFSSPTLTNCTISGNTASANGGAVWCYFSSNPTLTNCTISGNSASTYGGGVYCYSSSSPTLINCTISGNTDSTRGGGVYCEASGPALINCTISGNSASTYGGGVYCYSSSSPTLINCTIRANTARYGSAMHCHYCSNPALINCTISANAAATYGGAMYCYYYSNPTLTNCTISGNSAYSVAVYCDYYSSPALTNSILWNDSPEEIYVSSGTVTVTYCDIEGGYTGTGNIDADPLFVDAAGGDYRLAAGSPCIDAGNNGAVPADTLDLDDDGDTTEPLPLDLAGNPRFVDDPYKADTGNPGVPPRAVVDVGAYEVQFRRGDMNCDGAVDFDDISPFVLALVSQATYEARQPGCPWLNGDIDSDGDVNFDDINPFVKLLVGGG